MAITRLIGKQEILKKKFKKATLVFAALLLAFTSLASLVNFNQTTSAAESWETNGWKQVSVGAYHTCAIADDDRAYCWGWNSRGQIGDGGALEENVLIPKEVEQSGALANNAILQISTGYEHTCAVASDNNAYCWGNNDDGQLGDGSTDSSSTPVAVDMSGVLAGKTIQDVTAGYGHTCARTSDNNVYCWGNNYDGQLGDDSTEASSTPVAVDMSGVLAGKTVLQVSAGSSYTCALASDHKVYCWGNNNFNQMGNPAIDTVFPVSTPVAVETSGPLANKEVIKVSSGGAHACVMTLDNLTFCWGYNAWGQLGLGNDAYTSLPQPVDTTSVLQGKTVVDIATGLYHTCVIATDKQAYCAGQNSYGQLGDGSTTDRFSPVSTGAQGELAGKQVRQISGGEGVGCALAEDNRLYCWGTGALGNSSIDYSLVPIEVGHSAPSLRENTTYKVTANGEEKKVSLFGENFVEGAEVTIGDVLVQSQVLSGTEIKVTVSTANITETQVVGITVTNPNGKSATAENVFTYERREITNVRFDQMYGKKVMIIDGNGFVDMPGYGEGGVLFIPTVAIGGVSVPMCTEGTGGTVQSFMDMFEGESPIPFNLSDTPTCLLSVREDETAGAIVVISSTQYIIWLDEDFDTTLPGEVTVSGYDEDAFQNQMQVVLVDSVTEGFNQPADGGSETPETPIQPTIGVIGGNLANDPIISATPTFSGKAPAGSTVTVTVRSDPVICTTTADVNGNWICALPAALAAGQHSVTVVVTTLDNETFELGPYSVTVTADGFGGTVTDGDTPGVPNTGFLKKHATFVKQAKVEQQSKAIATSAVLGAGVSLLLVGMFFSGKVATRRILK